MKKFSVFYFVQLFNSLALQFPNVWCSWQNVGLEYVSGVFVADKKNQNLLSASPLDGSRKVSQRDWLWSDMYLSVISIYSAQKETMLLHQHVHHEQLQQSHLLKNTPKLSPCKHNKLPSPVEILCSESRSCELTAHQHIDVCKISIINTGFKDKDTCC